MRKLFVLVNCRGVTAIEYALIAGLIAVAIIVVLGGLKDSLVGIFQRITDALNSIPK
jgi:Flp pilus assembly pilin Flp